MGKFENNKRRNEEAELIDSFNQVSASKKKSTAQKKAAPQKKKESNKGAIVAICIAVAFVLIGAVTGILYSAFYTGDDGLILPNVYAAGVNLGGMTQEEATNVLHLSTDNTYTEKDMIIHLPNEEVHLSPANTKVQLDVDALVADAYQYGRTGSSADQRKARQEAENSIYTMDLLPYLNLNTAYIQSILDEIDAKYNTELTQPTVSISGERPSLIAESINLEAPKQVLTITLGMPESNLDITQLYGTILDGYSNNELTVTIDFTTQYPDAPDLEAIYKEYCVDPVDAVLDNNTYEVKSEVYGYGFDKELAKQQLELAAYGETLEFTLDYIKPEAFAESLGATLYQDELAFCEAYQASDYNRSNNLKLACQAINGIIVKPGEVFSYNEALGERTAEKGYLGAGAYVGGETVTQIGGGICQVSSALYYCTLYADLDVIERDCHQYPSSYVPFGMDATINWGTIDFKFKNNTNYPIKIVAEHSNNGRVKVWLMGTDEKDYYVKMSYTILKTYEWEEVTKDIKEEKNDKGYKDGEVITTPYTGFDVNTYKSKYSKATDELISTELEEFSHYSKRDKVIAHIITKETEPTTPPTTVPEETTPDTTPETTEPPQDTDPEETLGGIDGVAGED